MAIGFIRGKNSLIDYNEYQKSNFINEELDLEQMWNDARDSASLETQEAEREVRKLRIW